MPLRFDQFAKGLAGHVHVLEQLASGLAPAPHAAGQHGDTAITERTQAQRRAHGQAFAVVERDDAHIAARQACKGIQLQMREREIGGKQRMGLRMRRFLAHVEQGDLLARQQAARTSA
jgi:hypothetical protein